ncbi:MAG: hypothetical protein EPN91_05870 [Salinibacterium sp.]|nr:MAG: hypothetical protein EPN91_05870 [Salinibacterium sp.]
MGFMYEGKELVFNGACLFTCVQNETNHPIDRFCAGCGVQIPQGIRMFAYGVYSTVSLCLTCHRKATPL